MLVRQAEYFKLFIINVYQITVFVVKFYGAQNETYIEDWAERISNLLIYKMLCKIWVDGSAKRNVYVGLICSYI